MDETHTDVGEWGISRLFFNIVPTDIDAFVPLLHELEKPLLAKVGVLGPYSCFSVFIGGEAAPFKCPLQSREKVEVAGRHVRTVGGVVQALPTEGDNMVDRCCCCVDSLIVKVVHPTTNEEGFLWTQNRVTPHQFYAVPGNKIWKLIFRLSYMYRVIQEELPQLMELISDDILSKKCHINLGPVHSFTELRSYLEMHYYELRVAFANVST
jgi:hypothetical protein